MTEIADIHRHVTAIDPGTTESAVLTLRGGVVCAPEIMSNHALLVNARHGEWQEVAIEMIACYGMPVGRETFETCLLIGRLMEIFDACAIHYRLVYRRDVKIWLCNSMKAKDANVRQALIDKYGPPGTKKNPGKTYGISSHLWSALAIADYALGNPPTGAAK
jgi:hypothetical protein